MPTDVIMPALGMAQETGKVVSWLKSAGQAVLKGEPLLEIETDKLTVEIEAPASGTLVQISAAPGDEIPVGQVIALILAPGELMPRRSLSAALADRLGARAPNASPVAARMAAEHHLDLGQIRPDGGRIEKADVVAFLDAHRQAQPAGRVLASPKARRLAAERGLDIAMIDGHGPDGAVLADDVLRAATDHHQLYGRSTERPTQRPEYGRSTERPTHTRETGEADPSSVEPQPATHSLSAAWQVMTERMAQSWAGAPHFYLLREVGASRLIAWREQAQRRAPARLTYSDLLVKLAAAALRKHPRLNAAWHDGAIVENSAINIGLAVAVEDGLLVPVIQHADQLGLGQIAEQRHDLVERAQAGKLRPSDIQGGTFTISNLGMYGVDTFSAILNPPQAAILAVGRIAERVVAVAGQPAVRPMLMLSLSCDHRVVDGARGARFLETLAELIEEPLALVS